MTSKAPVVFIVFNRPKQTALSFQKIRQYQPKELFIIADGPRDNCPEDISNCEKVKEIINNNIDWNCKVHNDFSKENLSSPVRIRGGLHSVFEKVDRAIILEDDCDANADFFIFCETLLEIYKDEEKIWTITGDNFQSGRVRGDASYYFSKYFHCWGWATWSRSWNTARRENLSFWPSLKNSEDWRHIHPNKLEREYWSNIFEDMYQGNIDHWAYWFAASNLNNRGLTATPNKNLVTNQGFGPSATNTLFDVEIPGQKSHPIGELIHPEYIKQDFVADDFVYKYHYGGNINFTYRKILRAIGIEAFVKRVLKYFRSLGLFQYK